MSGHFPQINCNLICVSVVVSIRLIVSGPDQANIHSQQPALANRRNDLLVHWQFTIRM